MVEEVEDGRIEFWIYVWWFLKYVGMVDIWFFYILGNKVLGWIEEIFES